MNIHSTHYTIAQLSSALEDRRLTINKDYQRSDEVWPVFARSLLVETVLLGYPMPKLIVRQRTDMKSLKTFEEIVDGQQRTRALIGFFRGEFALANSLESEQFRGQTIHTLDEVDRQRYVTYAVGADLLVGATDIEVIEVFRRMNSYTAPLNPEEQRHASYQGAFKWFIYDLRKVCETIFDELGVFKQKAFVRMQDGKLLTELCHASIHGITTTSRAKLDDLYRKFDKEFPKASDLREALVDAITFVSGVESVPGSQLVKPYNFYSLVLASLQIRNPQAALVEHLGDLEGKLASDELVSNNLALLSDVLEDGEDADEKYEEFVTAASQTTNTKANRATRFQWFYRALTNQL
jgi:hypothetical protein